MFIPGEIISIATFPGVIVHEFAHVLFCKWRKVPILEVSYIRFGNPSGYVIHEATTDFKSTFLISMGPFFVNSLLCFLICFPAYMPISFFEIQHPLSIFLMWLGISIGMHAIPSGQDASNIYLQAKEEVKNKNVLAILSYPIVGLIHVFNALRILWIDAFYAFGLGVGLPSLIYGV